MKREAGRQRTTIIVLAAVGLGLLLGCGALVGLYAVAVGWQMSKPKKEPAKLYERDELRKTLKNATQEEVIRKLGKPYRTSDTGADADWMYEEVTYDKVNGKTDGFIHIHFRGGRVVSIDY